MSDEDALLAAITANPDEDTPRLAYADWLDESADTLPDPELARVRAEFIRAQVERLRCPYWLPGHVARYAELRCREREIEAQYRAAILGDAANVGAIGVYFTRGFPCLSMLAGVFLAHAERFAPLRPPILKVTNAADHWYDLFTHPLLPLVTDVSMTTWSESDTAWSLEPAIIGRMGELGTHNRVRGLDLSHCRVGDDGLYQLAERAAVWRLDDLDLSHNDIQYSGLVELLATPLPRALRRVNLCGNPITYNGARVLAERWPADGPLKWLRLEGTRIGVAGREVLRARFGEKVEFGPGD
jgi:uncharacterized protein (TIGR02996 family)